MVVRDNPLALATALTPPCPKARASTAAHSRSVASSSRSAGARNFSWSSSLRPCMKASRTSSTVQVIFARVVRIRPARGSRPQRRCYHPPRCSRPAETCAVAGAPFFRRAAEFFARRYLDALGRRQTAAACLAAIGQERTLMLRGPRSPVGWAADTRHVHQLRILSPESRGLSLFVKHTPSFSEIPQRTQSQAGRSVLASIQFPIFPASQSMPCRQQVLSGAHHLGRLLVVLPR